MTSRNSQKMTVLVGFAAAGILAVGVQVSCSHVCLMQIGNLLCKHLLTLNGSISIPRVGTKDAIKYKS